jgi:FkbM family methyltransferase
VNNTVQDAAGPVTLKPSTNVEATAHAVHSHRSLLSRTLGLLGRVPQYTNELGVARGLRWYLAKLLARVGAPGVKRLTILPPVLNYPISVRMYPSSDDFVFDQIFIQHEYGAICDAVKNASLIMDLGANVGYASALFASRYPSARIVAVEPDPGNYKQCTDNLAPYGPRVRALNGAVWARCSKLALARGGCDGRDWAVQVREAANGDANVEAWDMPALLELSGQEYIDILKIDIEGSEADVFASNTAQWLPRVRNICIELHSERCKDIFFSALSGFEYELRTQGEFTLCLNLKRRI